MEYARSSRSSGSLEPRYPLNSRSNGKTGCPSGTAYRFFAMARQNSRSCNGFSCPPSADALDGASTGKDIRNSATNITVHFIIDLLTDNLSYIRCTETNGLRRDAENGLTLALFYTQID